MEFKSVEKMFHPELFCFTQNRLKVNREIKRIKGLWLKNVKVPGAFCFSISPFLAFFFVRSWFRVARQLATTSLDLTTTF